MKNNEVRFGVITKVCNGFAFARVMNNAGTLTVKEVFLGSRQFVTVDESGSTPWLTEKIDGITIPSKDDFVAFLYHKRPVLRGGATPAYKWGILSNGDVASPGGYNGPLMEEDQPYDTEEDPELEALARSVCGKNVGVSHTNAYTQVHKGRSRHGNPQQRHRRAA